MQALPPVFVAPVPFADKPQSAPQIKAPAEASAGDIGAGSDQSGQYVLSEQVREVARLISEQMSEAEEDDVFPPLDTREVGDRDVIDPNRPATRSPEPIEQADAAGDLPPLPQEVSTDGSDEVEEPRLPGQAPEEADQAGADAEVEEPVKAAAPTGAPTPAPASPGAAAPDVPEPPAPGAVDIRR